MFRKITAATVSLTVSLLLLFAPMSAFAADSTAPDASPPPANTALIASAPPNPAPAVKTVNIVLDGLAVTSDVSAYVDGNGRTMAPVSVLANNLGAQTDWDAATKTVTVHEPSGGDITLNIGSPTLTINDNGVEFTITMDTVAVITADRTFIPLRFIAEALGLTVAWDADSQTAFLVRPDSGTNTFTNENVTVDAGTGYPLGGTLSIPDGAVAPCPCVVLVAGSGPNDRDETILGNKPFLDIANYLASNGIAVLRYDKRPHTYGAKMIQEFGGDMSVVQEYIQDAVAAGNLVKADPRIDPDRVYILGHSEGGMLAPRIDAEGGNFAGIIIMAGSPRNMTDIIYDQLMAQAQLYEGTPNYDIAMAQMAQIKQAFDSINGMTDDQAKATNMNDLLGPALGGSVSAYYYKEMADHPAEGYILNTTKPFLLMQGLSDIQVSPTADFKLYQDIFAGRDNAVFKEYDGLTHLFIQATAYDVVGNPNAYSIPGHVAPQVLEDIVSWVAAN